MSRPRLSLADHAWGSRRYRLNDHVGWSGNEDRGPIGGTRQSVERLGTTAFHATRERNRGAHLGKHVPGRRRQIEGDQRWHVRGRIGCDSVYPCTVRVDDFAIKAVRIAEELAVLIIYLAGECEPVTREIDCSSPVCLRAAAHYGLARSKESTESHAYDRPVPARRRIAAPIVVGERSERAAECPKHESIAVGIAHNGVAVIRERETAGRPYRERIGYGCDASLGQGDRVEFGHARMGAIGSQER